MSHLHFPILSFFANFVVKLVKMSYLAFLGNIWIFAPKITQNKSWNPAKCLIWNFQFLAFFTNFRHFVHLKYKHSNVEWDFFEIFKHCDARRRAPVASVATFTFYCNCESFHKRPIKNRCWTIILNGRFRSCLFQSSNQNRFSLIISIFDCIWQILGFSVANCFYNSANFNSSVSIFNTESLFSFKICLKFDLTILKFTNFSNFLKYLKNWKLRLVINNFIL